MREIKVYHYDAFSNIPGMGNPAGVVLDSDELTEEQMRQVAEKVGFNETAFPMKSDLADLRIRYFTPGHEINLCGHATMATIYALHSKGLLLALFKSWRIQLELTLVISILKHL